MSSPERVDSAATAVTTKQIAKFHKAKSVNAACLRCGKFNWNVLTLRINAQGIGPNPDGEIIVLPEGPIDICTLRCNTCGTIWMIDSQTVEDFIEDEVTDPNAGEKDGAS